MRCIPGMSFTPRVSEGLEEMERRIFCHEPMGLTWEGMKA